MAVPEFVTPTVRDGIFSSLGLDPDLTIGAIVGNDAVTVQFVTLDENGRLTRSNGADVVHTVTVPVQES